MSKYHIHSLALTNDEEERFLIVKNRDKIGIKKIFKTMLNALEPTKKIDDTIGDGKNKSAIVLNVPTETIAPMEIVEEE